MRLTRADSCISQLAWTCRYAGAGKVADFIVDDAGWLDDSIELKLPSAGPAARL